MRAKPAGLLFLGVCVVLAAVLLKKVLTFLATSLAFAITLVVLVLLSRRFRRSRAHTCDLNSRWSPSLPDVPAHRQG